jgi:hypothetical protein
MKPKLSRESVHCVPSSILFYIKTAGFGLLLENLVSLAKAVVAVTLIREPRISFVCKPNGQNHP